MARVYPDPDPMLRYVSEDLPGSFFEMTPEERSKRARFYIICRCSGEDAEFCIVETMNYLPSEVEYIEQIIANTEAAGQRNGRTLDEQIMELLRLDGGWVRRNG